MIKGSRDRGFEGPRVQGIERSRDRGDVGDMENALLQCV